MRNICKYAFVGVLLMVALGCVWADDYVDDVYYSPQPWGKKVEQPASSVGKVQNESMVVSNETKSTSQSVSGAKEDGKITIEYLPQTADTVVVVRIKK